MRRLKSTYTLLSDTDAPDQGNVISPSDSQSSSQHFSWAQILSAEPTTTASSQAAFGYSSNDFPDALPSQNVQNVLEHQHNLIKLDAWSDNDEIMFEDSSSIEISSVDSESTYGSPDPVQSDDLPSFPIVSSYGSVSLMLRHLVRVDISPDGAVYVQNFAGQSVAVINANGDKSCIIHINSHVCQDGQEVHVMTYHNRIAKICQRGIVFSSSSNSLAYLVDESGTKTTADRFVDLRNDFSLDVYYDGEDPILDGLLEQCYDMVAKYSYRSHQNGDDVWLIGGTQIKQDRYGNIEVSSHYRRRIITVLPTVGELSVQTPYVSATVSCYSKRYLTVHMNNCKITSGYCGLTVQNGSQKAGLDRNGRVVIF